VAPPPAAEPAPGSAPDIDALRKSAESDTALSEEARTSVLTLLQQAASFQQEAAQVEARLTSLAARVDSAPQRIEALKVEVAAPDEPPPAEPSDATLEQLQPKFRELELGLGAARDALKAAEDALGGHASAASEMANLITDRRARLDKLAQERKAPPVPGEPALVTQARQLALDARQALRTLEIKLFELRLTHRDALQDLLTLERNLAKKTLDKTQAQVEALQAIIQARRKAQAEQARREAETERVTASALPPSIRAVAETNLALTKELESVTRAEARVGESLLSAEQRASNIKVDFEATRQRVELVGSTPAIGRLLRRRLASLPSLGVYQRARSERRRTIESSTERQIDLDEASRSIAEPEAEAQALVDALTPPVDAAAREELLPRALELLVKKKALLVDLHKLHGRYVARLTALDAAQRELVAAASGYVAFAREHLTWIPNTPRLAASDALAAPSSLGALFGLDTWRVAAESIIAAARAKPALAVLGIVAVLALLWLRQRGQRAIVRLAEATRRIRTDAFVHTLKALLHTLVMAAAWPALGLLLAAALLQSASPSLQVRLAEAVLGAIGAWFTLGLLRWVCCKDGLADRHFQWPERVRLELRRALAWMLVLVPPLAFVFTFAASSEAAVDLVAVGRPAFLLLMLVFLVFFFHIFRGKGALASAMGNSQIGRLRPLWLTLVLAAPLLLAAVSVLGYEHSAMQFFTRLQATVWVLIALIILRDLVLRAFYVTERRLRFAEALRQREEARAHREAEGGKTAAEGVAAATSSSEIAAVEIEEVNFRDLGEQAQRLIRIGLLFAAVAAVWGVWQDFLPALGFLGRVELPLTATELVDGVERQVPVTLADLGLALLILALVMIAAKNLPGLLEIVVLQRLPLDAGARYAIVTLSQYAIVAVGFIVTFSTLGLQWSSIQWLVAALSVGLGFGLQEIVANFISGIILLLERPIRVGDVVTVGDTTGTVSRIRIRATTITNYDRQELLVPNKEFITGRLLNWTLTDRMNRIFLPVGIAYGDDVDRAMALIVEAAQECEQVLDTPAPSASFESFGDSALIINLRCFLATLDQRLATISQLHRRINQKLAEAGISIAFPQQDTHMEFTGPLRVQMERPVRGGRRQDASDPLRKGGGDDATRDDPD
jgi:potassium efflux system protein